MRRNLLALALLGIATSAIAGEAERVKLDLSAEQAQLIVQTLGQISCPNVASLANCRLAEATLRAIQQQASQQVR